MEKINNFIFSKGKSYILNNLFDHKSTPNWTIKERVISDNMLVFCLSGTGGYIIENKCYEIKRGRIIFLSHDVIHSAFQDENDCVSVIALRFSVCHRNGEIDAFDKCSFIYDAKDFQLFHSILQLFIKHRNKSNEIDSEISNGLCCSFFGALNAEKNYYEESGIYDKQMDEVAAYIDEMIKGGKELSRGRLIEHFSMSAYEFDKRFKTYFDTTYREYVFRKKIHYAQELLASTDMRVKEIAFLLGYSDAYIFSNQFKMIYKISPKKYRESI